MTRALLLFLLFPTTASAHAPGFAVLELHDREGHVDAVLRVAADTAIDVALVGCREGERRVVPRATGSEARFSARCPNGVRRVRASGIDEGGQLFVVLHDARGVRRAMADAHHPSISLSERGGFVRYLRLGLDHVIAGADHSLFVLGLLLFVRGWRRLAAAVTAFTIGHSVTLALAALDLVRVPAPPVECAIALSILVLAIELARDRPSLAREHPAALAACFGLLHGLGFASALRGAGLPRDGVAEALFGFNVGVELGQLGLVAIVLAGLEIATRLEIPSARRELARSLAVHALGGIAAYWTIARASALGT